MQQGRHSAAWLQGFEQRQEELGPRQRPRAAAAARRRLGEEITTLLKQAKAAAKRIKGLLPQPILETLKSHRRRLEGLVQKYGGGSCQVGGASSCAALPKGRIPVPLRLQLGHSIAVQVAGFAELEAATLGWFGDEGMVLMLCLLRRACCACYAAAVGPSGRPQHPGAHCGGEPGGAAAALRRLPAACGGCQALLLQVCRGWVLAWGARCVMLWLCSRAHSRGVRVSWACRR